MCRVPENPKTRPEPRLFYWPEPDPNPKKKSKTRPEPTRKNCKPARNPTGFISSKVRAKLPIFWWEFGFFQKNLPPYQFYIFYSAHIFLLFFINQNFFCNFYPKNSIFRPQNQTRNLPETRHSLPEPDPNPKEKIKTRLDPNPKKISKPEPDLNPTFAYPTHHYHHIQIIGHNCIQKKYLQIQLN